MFLVNCIGIGGNDFQRRGMPYNQMMQSYGGGFHGASGGYPGYPTNYNDGNDSHSRYTPLTPVG